MHIENKRMSQSDSESWAKLTDEIRATCAAMTQAGIVLIQPDAITLSETTLGDGANGTVYLGKITTRADVAIKLVTATGIKSARASLFDFQNEMQMNHLATNEIRQGRPSRMAETICGAVAIDESSVRFYIVMRYIRCSEDLADLIQDERYWNAIRHNGRDTGAKLTRNFTETERTGFPNVFAYVMSRRRKLAIAIEIAQALVELSHTGIAHLDWKPGNILAVAAPNRGRGASEGFGIKLIDFGDAAIATDDELLDYTTGTAGYSAPEIEFGAALLASDVFSVGVTLLELWVGCLWKGAKTEIGYQKERQHALSNVSKSDPKISRIISECLSHDPTKRPTAERLLKRLMQVR